MLIIWSQLQLNSLSPAQPGPDRDLGPLCGGVVEMRWALSSGSSRVAVSLRRATDCGQNPGGFSGLEPELLHSRLTATERLWLIYADVLIDHRQLSPGRPASLLSKKKKKKRRRPNKQARREELCLPAADEEAAIRESRSFTYPPHGFVWFCLTFFIYAFIYFFQQTLTIRRNLTARIFKYYRYSQDIRRASSPRTRYYHRRNWY